MIAFAAEENNDSTPNSDWTFFYISVMRIYISFSAWKKLFQNFLIWEDIPVHLFPTVVYTDTRVMLYKYIFLAWIYLYDIFIPVRKAVSNNSLLSRIKFIKLIIPGENS